MIKPLTSLRFFFAFFVFLSHLSFITTNNDLYNWFKRNIFFEGYLGVSFFFILSGFVLSYSSSKYIEDNSFKLNKKKFYLARIFRIYPLHLMTLLITVLLFYDFSTISISRFVPNLFLLQSFIPIQTYYYSFNSPSWSISNEMFFYISFPFVFSFCLKFKKTAIFLFFIFIFLLFGVKPIVSPELQKFIYYVNPLSRLLDFTIGIFLFFLHQKFQHKMNNKLGVKLEITSLIVFLLFFIPHNYFDRAFRFSIYYWIPMAFMVLVFSFQKGIISKLLSNKFLVYLGEISFAFYMIHIIVINCYNLLKFNTHLFYTPVLLLIISLVLSALIFEFFEKPINNYLKRKFIQ